MARSELVLTMEQMRNLADLGFKTDKASMVYHPATTRSEHFSLLPNGLAFSKEFWSDKKRIALVGEDMYERMHGRDVFAFTANDLMAILPDTISIGGICHSLYVSKKTVDNVSVYVAAYSFINEDGRFVSKRNDTTWESTIMVQLLHTVLLWLVENKFVKPDNKK